MYNRVTRLICLTWICVSTAWASEDWVKHEWSLGSGIGIYTETVNYRTHFSPYQAGNRSASQHVRFRGEEFPTFSVGYTHWLTKQWGVTLAGRYARTEWRGDNQPIPIQFAYNAWMPSPPYPRIEVDRMADSPRRATGSWVSYQAMLGLKRRVQWGPMEWVAEGFVVHERTEGMTLESLYFENTIMISRGSLMTSSLLMDLNPEQDSFSRTGGSLGVRASLPLNSKISLFANATFVWLPSRRVPLSLESIDPIHTFYNADTLEKVSELTEFEPFNTPDGKLALEAGLLLRF